jgi:hypothetical protein
MPYTQIVLPDHIGPCVRWVVRRGLDPRLSDVHALLRLPLPELGITGTGHFTIAATLFECIEGVSAVLFPRTGNPSKTFLECMMGHYGVEGNEPSGALPTQRVATELLFAFRNPMQHCLGLALRHPDRQGVREPFVMPHELLVFRETSSLAQAKLEALERQPWPEWLHCPTLQMREQNTMCLSVEAFYVGTRRLIESVLADERAMVFAEEFLQAYRSKQETAQFTAMHEIFHNAIDAGFPGTNGEDKSQTTASKVESTDG